MDAAVFSVYTGSTSPLRWRPRSSQVSRAGARPFAAAPEGRGRRRRRQGGARLEKGAGLRRAGAGVSAGLEGEPQQHGRGHWHFSHRPMRRLRKRPLTNLRFSRNFLVGLGRAAGMAVVTRMTTAGGIGRRDGRDRRQDNTLSLHPCSFLSAIKRGHLLCRRKGSLAFVRVDNRLRCSHSSAAQSSAGRRARAVQQPNRDVHA